MGLFDELVACGIIAYGPCSLYSEPINSGLLRLYKFCRVRMSDCFSIAVYRSANANAPAFADILYKMSPYCTDFPNAKPHVVVP
jgi:hypothetical protein